MADIREVGATADPDNRKAEVRRVVGFREMVGALRPYRRPLLAALAIGLISTATAASQPLVVGAIVDQFGKGLPFTLIAVLGGLLLLNGVVTAVRQLVLQRAGERYAFDTRARIVRHLYSLPMSDLEHRKRGDLVSRVSADVTQTRDIITSGLVDLVSQAITVAVSLVLMAFIDPVLLSISAAVVVVIITALVIIARRCGPAGLRHQEAIGELAGSVARTLGSMKTIRAARATHREGDASVRFARRAMKEGLVIARLRALVESFSGISIQILLVVVIGTGGLRVSMGALTVGELSAFIMYLVLMATPLAMVGGIISMLNEALGALSRIREIEEIPAERDIEIADTPQNQSGAASPAVFEFANVGFAYPNHDLNADGHHNVLKGVSLTVEEGVTTALVGPSGAGKSTIIALMERFYEPTAGRILFYGRDVQTLSRDELRSKISYVDQESIALSGSVRENLLLGAPQASEDDCAMVLVQVGLAVDRATALLLLDSEVGELGIRLSGGERQRLAIARAYIANSPVFLLDEVTSNLDSGNEALVQDLILRSPIPRTVVVIAHRFSTVVNADKIILLEEGCVSATGTHSELLERSTLYRDLARHQLDPPREGRRPSDLSQV